MAGFRERRRLRPGGDTRGRSVRHLGEEGATAIEYALILALIAVAIVGALGLLGNALDSSYRSTGDRVGEVADQAGQDTP